MATRFANMAGGTAISPSSPARRWRTTDGVRLAVGGVADRPMARDFPAIDGDALDDALNDLAWDLEARDDLHATAGYRRGLVRRLGRAAIEEAQRCRT